MVIKMLTSAQPRKGAMLGHKINTSARVSKYQLTKFADQARRVSLQRWNVKIRTQLISRIPLEDTQYLWSCPLGLIRACGEPCASVQ